MAAEPLGEPATLELDPEGCEVGFLMRTTWHKVLGRATIVSGSIISESGDLFTDGRVTVEVDAASIETGNERRDSTMRESHLETRAYPKITFISTAPPDIISTVSDSSGAYGEVSFGLQGNLSIHGVTRRVILPVTARLDGVTWIMTGEVRVRLTEYDIPDPSIVVNRVQDEVLVTYKVRTAER